MSNTEITTDYYTINIDEDGRGFTFHLNPGIKSSPHRKALMSYVKALHKQGVDEINADHLSMPYFNRNLKLDRGKRRLDCVYKKGPILYECELKSKHECGLDRTYIQVKEQAQYCERLTLVVPRDMIDYVTSNLKIRNINNVSVDTFEI